MSNINTAIAEALCMERALNILKEGYSFTDELGDGTLIAVCKPGKLAADYWIMFGKCDCPDFMKTGRDCKHMIANEIKKADEEMMEALCAEWEARQLIEA